MDTNYDRYGSAAIEAALCGVNPIVAWKKATKELSFSDSSQEKPCPKNAFLGLCEDGLVKGIKADFYLKKSTSKKNKKYAIAAVKLLRTNSTLSRNELWNHIAEEFSLGDMPHNSQMDVVLGLWSEKLIVKKSMTAHNKYAKTAIECVENFKESNCIKEMWVKYVKENFDTKSSQEKGCPKNAFLGLCEEGLVKGIPKGNYTKSVKNKEYALQAIDILKQNTFLPKELWEQLELGDKKHNSQMNVVLALWENDLILK
ncbi:hypothetical protein CXF68_16265 [Tenacibaculum sp. Bg11-29]|uniref:DUF6979 family protein n=1 Tax=Tenacibaculum sp. Bg11-29 TaxID=2058306 RepID=UPI000C348A9F|nr:hypothetical protein [Tenacibaculum sp. Bg11-29]PKH52150.1 hypothetical protein CXF68_16265 [Tenacibaculum sp. Bg11-29]